MKTYLFLLIALLALLTSCSTFPTTYDRVDPGKARLLDIIYEPPEAAPGDTVLCKAVFAGDEITADEIAWSVSYNLVTNMYGFTNALDTIALNPAVLDCTFSDSTSCIAFRFVIPDSIMLTSPLIPDNWMSTVPKQYHNFIPEEFKSMSKAELVAMVDGLSRAAAAGTLDLSALDPGLRQSIPSIAQLLTVQMRFYADCAGRHTIESYYSVRYNSRFAALAQSGVYVNTNPVIDSVGLYKVKKEGLQSFSPKTDSYEYEFARLYGPGDSASSDSIVTITIDKGYSYFVAGFTSRLDSTLSIDAAMGGGSPLVEKHLTQWYFELSENEVSTVSAYDYMNIVNMQNMIEPLYPSVDRRLVSATIWLQVFDQLLNEVFRPQGSALKELRLRFAYTDSYIDAANANK